jgi:hypothetical protein
MATLEELESRKLLYRFRPKRLKRHEFEDRQLWFFPEVVQWLLNDLPKLGAFYPENQAPYLQANVLMKSFVLGAEFVEKTMFWKMRPYRDDVFELKSADIRFFGWFVKPKVFVVACFEVFENVHAEPGVHDRYRDEVIRKRSLLPLDDPKYIKGAKADHVF